MQSDVVVKVTKVTTSPKLRLLEATADEAELADLDREPFSIGDEGPGVGRQPRARDYDADQVQRIARGDEHDLVALLPPDGAERLDRLRQRELLADETL